MRRASVLFLLCVTAFAATKINPQLQGVKALFVSGNNQAAEKVRDELQSGRTCFTLVGKADDADAVLAVDTDSKSQGEVGGFGEFGGRNWIASGTLTLKSGDLVWSRSERFSDAPFSSGGKVAGRLLLDRLSKEAGCKK